MSNDNSLKITIAEKELMKLSQTVNRESAVEQGFYDGRFSPRVVADKKKTEYLRLRRNKVI